jgi:hypothetical protein
MASLVLGLLISWLLGSRLDATRVDRPLAACLGVWALAPPLVLFLVSVLSPFSLFTARYFIAAMPALALVHAYLIRSLDPPAARFAAALAVVLLSTAISTSPRGDAMRTREDFRGACRAARELVAGEDVPVLLVSGLIESAQEDWRTDRERREYLAAPVSYYPTGGRVIPVPSYDVGQARLTKIVENEVAGADRFLFLERGGTSTFRWFQRELSPRGFRAEAKRYGLIGLAHFERSRPPASRQ